MTAETDVLHRSLLRRASRAAGTSLQHVTRAEAGWQYLTFEAQRLSPGLVLRRGADDQELLVIVLEGRASVRAAGHLFDDIGTRETVFDGPPPAMVLVAPGSDVEVATAAGALVVVGSAAGGEARSTRLIRPEDVLMESRGSGNTSRRIHHLLPSTAEAGRLIAFEVFTPGGNWSSYPPHKHDTQDPPRETYLEEIYFYRFAKPSGFAFQRVYSADGTLDEVLTARDGDVVLVPRGYHVVAAAPGYDCYYLNVMAGPTREWRFTVDPEHEWLMDWDPNKPKT
jgi:5-deoxy-glucuronate isomerase